jgi:hypothetical protein
MMLPAATPSVLSTAVDAVPVIAPELALKLYVSGRLRELVPAALMVEESPGLIDEGLAERTSVSWSTG